MTRKIVCIIAAITTFFIFCGCSKNESEMNEETEQQYYKSHEAMDGYSLFQSVKGNFCIQLPKNSSWNEDEKENSVLCALGTDTKEKLNIYWGKDNAEEHYKNVNELKEGLDKYGVNIAGEVASFEPILDENGYTGYRFILIPQSSFEETNYMYYVYYFNNNYAYSFVAQVSDIDGISMNTIDKCLNSFYIINE